MKTIHFNNGTGGSLGSLTVDAVAPPAGVTFSADGSRITISKTVIPAAWYTAGQNNSSISLITASDRNATTANGTVLGITTLP